VESASLVDRILASEQRLGAPLDRVGEVLEFELVRVDGLEGDLSLDAKLASDLDPRRCPAVPEVWQEEGARLADDLQLVDLGDVQPLPELGDDAVCEEH